jgi:hypothetical protein
MLARLQVSARPSQRGANLPDKTGERIFWFRSGIGAGGGAVELAALGLNVVSVINYSTGF